LLCDIYLLRPAERKSSMHFDLEAANMT